MSLKANGIYGIFRLQIMYTKTLKMSILELVFEPNSVLHQVALPVTDFNAQIVQLSLDLKETMVHSNGVGLAAPQINKLIRMFVVAHKDGIKTFINPQITWRSLRKSVDEEGCLSIPGVFGPVRRPYSIKISYFDEYGVEHTEKATGFYARVIQHEYDHLDGILFTEKLVD